MPATNASDWRKSREQEVTLPNGNVARLQRVHILDLAMQGAIPALLDGLVSEMIAERKTRVDLSELGKYGGLVDVVAKACFVEPRVGDEASEEQLAVAEIDAAAKLAVFAWSHPEGEQLLRGFCAQQTRPVDAAQPGRGVRGVAQRNSGSR